MTREEKEQILLKDLSARLPYGVKVDVNFNDSTEVLSCSLLQDFILSEKVLRPYLRPLSSMTEEEENEYRAINCYEGLFPHNEDALDYVLERHFDYRGLIHMGLALEAKDGMYE